MILSSNWYNYAELAKYPTAQYFNNVLEINYSALKKSSNIQVTNQI